MLFLLPHTWFFPLSQRSQSLFSSLRLMCRSYAEQKFIPLSIKDKMAAAELYLRIILGMVNLTVMARLVGRFEAKFHSSKSQSLAMVSLQVPEKKTRWAPYTPGKRESEVVPFPCWKGRSAWAVAANFFFEQSLPGSTLKPAVRSLTKTTLPSALFTALPMNKVYSPRHSIALLLTP